jgi:hypothetical protein
MIGVSVVMMGVPAAMFRLGQSKGVHFVVSGSLDIPVAGSPKDRAVYVTLSATSEPDD